MTRESVGSILAILLSTGAIGWAFSIYGIQREQTDTQRGRDER